MLCVHRKLAIVLGFLLVSAVGVHTFANRSVQSSKTGEKSASGQLMFVREFSSAQDVKGISHPILNKTLDIIAGPKEPSPPAASMLQQPYAVTTDLTHRVLVTDGGSGAVHIFDFARAQYLQLRGGDRLRSPLGVASDSENNVYVSDSSLRTILVYDSRGKFAHYFKKSGSNESYFDAPAGIAVDRATDRVYVCDTPRHMVVAFDKKGHVLTTFGKRGGGTGPGEFKDPIQVVTNGGELLVLDSGSSRIQILDLRGRFRQQIKLASVGRRAGLAVDHDGNIYVTDPELNHIQVLNRAGHLLYQVGETGTGTAQFQGVSGAWVDSGHCLYVVDSQNKRVQEFQIGTRGTAGC